MSGGQGEAVQIIVSAVVAAIVGVDKVVSHRSSRKRAGTMTRIENLLGALRDDLTRLKSIVVGADDRNGLRGTLEQLRSDFERDCSTRSQEREDRHENIGEWREWRAGVNHNIDLALEEAENARRRLHDDIAPKMQALLVGVALLAQKHNVEIPDPPASSPVVGLFDRRNTHR